MDGLAKASILDIDGVAVPAEGDAFAAYSVRLLGSAVGVPTYSGACMRVRRDSDNVEADVGFDSNDELSLTSPISNTSDAQSYTDFADFVDHTGTPANAFLRAWYDQSSNGYDAQQATATSQAQIYDGTAITTDSNGNIATKTGILMSATIPTTANDPFFTVFMSYATGRREVVGLSATGGAFLNFEAGWNSGTQAKLIIGDGSTFASTSGTISSAPQVMTSYKLNDVSKLFSSSSQVGSTLTDDLDNTTTTLEVGGRNKGGDGYISEVLVYTKDMTASQSTIVANLEAYYTV